MNNKIIIALLVFVGLVVGTWWLNANKKPKESEKETVLLENKGSVERVKKISPEIFNELVQNPETFVLDVHTPEQTHIPGTDAFIDYTKIKDSQSQLPTDKNTPIIVYCRSGGMSAQASQDLLDMGYTQVYDLEGGTNAYKQTGFQSVSISPESQPLGTVVYGDVPETEFVLTNYTNKVLTVTRLSTSCGCTQAFLDKKELKPFSSVQIKVTFDPAVHGDATDLGELTRTVYVETDNPNFSKLEVTITANVVK